MTNYLVIISSNQAAVGKSLINETDLSRIHIKMKKELNKVAKDINQFLNSYLKKQIKTSLIAPMRYGLFPGGKKIRSKILIDVGKICNANYKTLIKVGAAIECIHAYSLIHDDLPCMDNDEIRRGKLSTHKKFGESTAVLAGNSILILIFGLKKH